MFGWILNAAYVVFLLICSPVLLWRWYALGKYHSGWNQKLWGECPVPSGATGPRVWFHAVSVGEVLQLQQVLAQLTQVRPDVQCIVSTTTQTGYEVARDKLKIAHVVYFPLDFTWAVRNSIRRLKPDLIVLVELEIWPNFLRSAFQKQIPVCLINGRLSDRSFAGYHRLKWLLGPLLREFAFVAAQTEEYATRFAALGVEPTRVHNTGSIKFDGVQTDRSKPKTRELAQFFGIREGEQIWIAGSTQAPEEAMVLDIYLKLKQTHPRLRLILVPRHPERGDEVARLITDRNLPLIRRTKPEPLPESTAQHVGLLDTVGELGACWGLADIGFVGGSFGDRGGQNMLEPAAYGAAVSVGPNTKNFRAVVDLLVQGQALHVSRTPEELLQFIDTMLQNPKQGTGMGERAQKLIAAQQGATARTVQLIVDQIEK
ncbi:MAG: 3-deoxy-D-manno-octulosonic acid transferase [Planctomycetaceae bacterium]|nr:3-deoxy-D-manno-octulosonic acid transferase [Planctomycetaceae bacterium]